MALKALLGSGQGLLVLLPLLFWLFTSVVQASAIPPPTFIKPKLPSLEDCRGKITAPGKDTLMYFTGLKTRKDINTAKKYAEDHGMTHVSKVYPDGFTDPNRYEGTDEEKRQFQKDFSQVYAEKTTGTAYLMLDDDKEPASDSIFYTVEFKAMKDGGHVDKILRFPFTSPPDKPKDSTKKYWEKSSDAAGYATGWCGVHITHYQIPEGGSSYSVEATIFDAHGIEIGRREKTDATEPVGVTGALPYVLMITAAKPGSSEDPDSAPISFAYGDQSWNSDKESQRCKFGGYEDGNREGDCGFTC